MKFVRSVLISSLVLGGHFLSGGVYAQDLAFSCVAGDSGAALLVNVENIRTQEGNLRAQIYSSNPDDFLAKGKKLVRLDVPVIDAGEQAMCVQLPSAGKYALVVMHDKNANGKADFLSEGFGFSNNPKLGLGAPDAEEVIMDMPAGVTETTVKLKYILGGDDEKKEKRRKARRR
ncbi:DUF2141 domain-containing protein [Kordiimonas laminariae]|uniref:DUF2141 domain-containing protein n=1 Tax=Kordiimonas laminariae TaxID=2917717 RepID=UPI001FF3972D|nr:DUF2141 domain-containing protein [Kordiimonas laminariae]MCK0070970.1 DUF2141 domain-containing protein [Kordiimonas laminariae]